MLRSLRPALGYSPPFVMPREPTCKLLMSMFGYLFSNSLYFRCSTPVGISPLYSTLSSLSSCCAVNLLALIFLSTCTALSVSIFCINEALAFLPSNGPSAYVYSLPPFPSCLCNASLNK